MIEWSFYLYITGNALTENPTGQPHVTPIRATNVLDLLGDHKRFIRPTKPNTYNGYWQIVDDTNYGGHFYR